MFKMSSQEKQVVYLFLEFAAFSAFYTNILLLTIQTIFQPVSLIYLSVRPIFLIIHVWLRLQSILVYRLIKIAIYKHKPSKHSHDTCRTSLFAKHIQGSKLSSLL